MWTLTLQLAAVECNQGSSLEATWKQLGSREMLVVCPASKDLLKETNVEKMMGHQSVENMILVLKEELEGERDKRREAEEMASRFSNQLEIEEKEKEAFIELSKKYTSTDKFEVIVENEDLKAKLAARVEKEMQILRDFEQMKAEKKILEQTVLCEIQSRRRQRGGESLRAEMEDFLLKAFFIRPVQGTALDLAIPQEARDF